MRNAWIVCALIVFSAQVQATTLHPMRATDLVDQAELIFIGTAVDRQVATTRDGSYPYTFITFKVEHHLKGATADEQITLRFEGGELGDEYIHVHGMPEFERNGEYLLFVADNGQAISPIVGWELGAFELVEHPSRPGEKVMLDRSGLAIEGIGNGRFLRSRVERDGRSVKRAGQGSSGVTILEENNVVITDPNAPSLEKAHLELMPASVAFQALRNLVTARAPSKAYRPGAVLPSLTIDDVPDTFSLRDPAGSNR